jgi:transposase-like protein
MKRTRHTPEQVVAKLRHAERGLAEGQTVGQVCKQLSVSEHTCYRWHNQYGGVQANEAKRLKESETESTRLKKIVAQLTLDIAALKDLLSRSGNPVTQATGRRVPPGAPRP